MTTNSLAITEIIKAMQTDAEEIMNLTDLASADISEGRQNGAMGALCGLDHHIERLTSLLSAVRVIHRTAPL